MLTEKERKRVSGWSDPKLHKFVAEWSGDVCEACVDTDGMYDDRVMRFTCMECGTSAAGGCRYTEVDSDAWHLLECFPLDSTKLSGREGGRVYGPNPIIHDHRIEYRNRSHDEIVSLEPFDPGHIDFKRAMTEIAAFLRILEIDPR